MATLVVVLVFVALGLAVLFVALSGGPAGARRRMGRQSRRSRRVWVVGFIVTLVVLGVGVPAAVIATVQARDDIPEANVADLTAAEQRGRQLFGERCRNCHSLDAANAVADVGPDLDQLRPPRELVLNAIEQGRARGNGQMPADLAEGEDAEAIAAFVAKAVGQTAQRGES
jgi:mono/diheme cytochrome c family protein